MKDVAAIPRPYHHGDLRRALIDAAVSLVAEEQDWSFSLREVARRAGVSHNAPYNHFPEKRDLLAAVAAVGFETLRDGMIASMDGITEGKIVLAAAAQAYVKFATSNPALFRLMFGPELASSDGTRPDLAEQAGAEAKNVLRGIISRGAIEGAFAVEKDKASIAMAVLSTWSAIHGLAMLIVDGRSDEAGSPNVLVEGVMQHFLDGLRKR